MRYTAAVVLAFLLVACAGCDATPPPPIFSQGPTAAIREVAVEPPTSAAKTQWPLLSGLALMRTSMDISSDRKWAVVWGNRTVDEESKRTCWLIDLVGGDITDLRAKSQGKVAAVVGKTVQASFSPDAARLLVLAEERQSACVVHLSTGETVVIEGVGESDVFWAGNRLFFTHWQGKPMIGDATGRPQARPKVGGWLVGCDPTGTKLLQVIPQVAVVNLDGEILREFGGHSCDKDMPLMSRSGNWVGSYCNVNNEWGYYVASTTTDEVLRLRRPWGATLALTDNGDSLFAVGGGNSTFGAIVTGGQRVEAGVCDIVFWPKGDDPWKSTPGAPKRPTFNDLLWNNMPKGKSQIIARKAMAVALLGKELFFVEAEGDQRRLKAVSLPESTAPVPGR